MPRILPFTRGAQGFSSLSRTLSGGTISQKDTREASAPIFKNRRRCFPLSFNYQHMLQTQLAANQQINQTVRLGNRTYSSSQLSTFYKYIANKSITKLAKKQFLIECLIIYLYFCPKPYACCVCWIYAYCIIPNTSQHCNMYTIFLHCQSA